MTPAEAEQAFIALWEQGLQTTVTSLPGKTCEGRFNPRTRQWEGRCH
jgi:hypothetical protein